MKPELVTISREEYKTLKKQAKIDMGILSQFVGSLKDIKAGRIRRVK